jgi:hypothetical protein
VPDELAGMPAAEVEDMLCRSHLGVWTARTRGMEMAPLHWEWCELAMTESRLCVVAPREHSKTETFTVHATCWRSMQTPGLQTYVFCQTGDQAKVLLGRIADCMEQTHPWMVRKADVGSTHAVFSNGSEVSAAGAGKAVRGPHPDVVIGDDVLEEQQCLSELQRKRTERWWKGTVSGMTHPWTKRRVRPFPGAPLEERWFEPTRIFLVGTPFHSQDLLMSMRANPIYRFRRYAAEFHPDELVAGTLAVEAN